MTPSVNDLAETVDDVQRRVTTLEAISGRITLSPGLLMFVWVVAVAMVGAAGTAAVTAYQTHEIALQVRELTSEVRGHTKQTFHDKGEGKYDGLRREVDELKARSDRH